MKINKVITGIRVSDAADVGDKLHGELDTSRVEDPHLTAIKQDIKAIYDRLISSLHATKAESEMEEYDMMRDNTYRSMMYLNKGYLLHPEANIKGAAIDVEKVFENYGFELINLNYAAESSMMEAFIRDMTTPQLTPKVAVLPGMADLLTKLDDSQNQFKMAESRWNDTQNENAVTANASSHKSDLLKLINNKLVVYLRAMQQVNPEPYQALALSISAHINQANALVKRRSTTNENAETSN
jgi:hypothetical protein